jgi:orotidine-5'-phosphate decarboxylase
MNDPKIIIALDYHSASQALNMVAQLDPTKCKLKVGKQLFTATGPAFIESIQKLGFNVFLDLKFHDIPNTVSKALSVAADLGVWMVNVHASGGVNMLEAAANSLSHYKDRPLLTAVTVLTSLSSMDLRSLGIERSIDDHVLSLAQLSKSCGLDGVVCSAQEAHLIRQSLGDNFCIVTPGIRPSNASSDDQTRVVTPEHAVQLGSDYLVIGRPITAHDNPMSALNEINKAILNV